MFGCGCADGWEDEGGVKALGGLGVEVYDGSGVLSISTKYLLITRCLTCSIGSQLWSVIHEYTIAMPSQGICSTRASTNKRPL